MLDAISAFLRGFFYAAREGAEKCMRECVGMVVDECIRRAGKKIILMGLAIVLLGFSLLFLGLGAATLLNGFIALPGGGYLLVGLFYGLLGLVLVLAFLAFYR